MAKRKEPTKNDRNNEGEDHEDDDSGSEDLDILNVEFEWFDPQPAVDFHGLKTLLRQLFDADAQLFDLSALTDLILSQPLLGSTVKVDGNETDPYAFLTVLNLEQHKDTPVIQELIKYLKSKVSSRDSLSALKDLLSKPTTPPIGLILTERLINIPAEVVPPMYTMLLEEISWAVDDKEPYTFSHYLILSKTYEEVESQLDTMEARPQKKKKKRKDAHRSGNDSFYFHPEDEVFERHAMCHGSYDYSKPQDGGHADSKRAFQELGIKPQGQLMLIDAAKFEAAVNDVSNFLQPPV